MAANLILIAGLFSTNQVFAANTNILANPGFETGSFTGWTTFGNVLPNVSVQSGASQAHGGAFYLKTYGQFIGATNYSGIYQDNLSAPSNTYTADGWAFSLGSDGGGIHGQDAIWLEVSFRDAAYNALALYRSVVVTSNILAGLGGTNKWVDLQITNQCSFANPSAQILLPGTITNTVTTLIAPASTVYVRFQVVFAQGPSNDNGSMYFDDLTLNQTAGTVVSPPVTQMNIVWSDEFNGTSINTNNWTYDLGGGGFGNNELEFYTNSPQNAYVSNGLLHIVALTNGSGYTSARMKTQGKQSWAYGRMEARIQIPRGQGIWPAFWMLGTNIVPVGWPTCGEIDIMENIGKTSDQGTDHGTIHGPQNNSCGGDYNCGGGVGGTYTLPGGAALADNFHIFAVEWTTNQIKWFMDTINYFTATPASLPANSSWVFTQPQFFILNVAVGGNWPGNPDGTTVFPQQMLVDYVRVYQQTAPLAISFAAQPNGSFILSWPTNIVCHLQTQTNALASGTNWFDTSVTTSPFVVSPDPGNVSVFYRLESP